MNQPLHDKFKIFQDKILSWNDIEFHKALLIIYHPDPDSIIAAAILCRTLMLEQINYMVTPAEFPIIELQDRAPSNQLPYVIFIGFHQMHLQSLPEELEYLAILKSNSFNKSSEILSPEDFEMSYPEINLSTIALYLYQDVLASHKYLEKVLILPFVAYHTIKIKENFNPFLMELFKEAQELHLIQEKKTLGFLGMDILPIREVLVFSNDPFLPNLTDNDNHVVQLLSKANIITETSEGERKFSDLDQDELRDLNSQIVKYLSNNTGFKSSQIDLVRSKYILLKEKQNSILSNTWDYAQAIIDGTNQERFSLVLAVLLGNRKAKLDDLTHLYKQERRVIITSHDLVMTEIDKIVELSHLRYLKSTQPINWYNASSLASLTLTAQIVNINQPFVIAIPKTDTMITLGISASQHLIIPDDLDHLVRSIIKSRQLHSEVSGDTFSAQVSVPESLWESIIIELNDKLSEEL